MNVLSCLGLVLLIEAVSLVFSPAVSVLGLARLLGQDITVGGDGRELPYHCLGSVRTVLEPLICSCLRQGQLYFIILSERAGRRAVHSDCYSQCEQNWRGVFMSSSQNIQSEHPVTEVDAGVNRVSCDGGGGALGHPRIWLTLTAEADEAQASVVCPYCSRHFIRRNG